MSWAGFLQVLLQQHLAAGCLGRVGGRSVLQVRPTSTLSATSLLPGSVSSRNPVCPHTPAGQHFCPHTCRFHQCGGCLLAPLPVTGSAYAATLCCLQSVAGLLDAQACAAEGLQPRLAAEAGLQALRACAGELPAFEQLWAHLQLGQRLQALRQPGLPSHAGTHSALPAVALRGSLPVPSSPFSSRAGRSTLVGSRHLASTHEGTGSWVMYAVRSTYHFCRRGDQQMLLTAGWELGEAAAQTLDWLQLCRWRQLPTTCCSSLNAAELGSVTGVMAASKVAAQAAADPGMRDPTRWWLGAQEVGQFPPAKVHLATTCRWSQASCHASHILIRFIDNKLTCMLHMTPLR